jgi:hypothetical protein
VEIPQGSFEVAVAQHILDIPERYPIRLQD